MVYRRQLDAFLEQEVRLQVWWHRNLRSLQKWDPPLSDSKFFFIVNLIENWLLQIGRIVVSIGRAIICSRFRLTFWWFWFRFRLGRHFCIRKDRQDWVCYFRGKTMCAKTQEQNKNLFLVPDRRGWSGQRRICIEIVFASSIVNGEWVGYPSSRGSDKKPKTSFGAIEICSAPSCALRRTLTTIHKKCLSARLWFKLVWS